MKPSILALLATSLLCNSFSFALDADSAELLDDELANYLQATGLDQARGAVWCDPIPNCEQILLRTLQTATEDSIFVVVIAPEGSVPSEAETAFLKKFVEIIRKEKIEVLGVAFMPNDEFSIRLKCWMSKAC